MTHSITRTASKSAIAFILGMSLAAPLYAANDQIDLNTDLTVGSLDEYSTDNAMVDLVASGNRSATSDQRSLTQLSQMTEGLDFGEPEAMRQKRLSKLGYGFNDRQSLQEFKAKKRALSRERSSQRVYY